MLPITRGYRQLNESSRDSATEARAGGKKEPRGERLLPLRAGRLSPA